MSNLRKKSVSEKKPVAAEKKLTFQGKEVEILLVTKSRKDESWDLLDLVYVGEKKVFRIKRKSLD